MISTTVRSGLAALAKVLLVLVGVPLALARLWLLAPLPAPLFRPHALSELSTWSHLLLLVVAGTWMLASVRLVLELRHAYRNPSDASVASWSARWAGELAGLLLLATSGTLASATLHQPAAPSAVSATRPGAPRPAPAPLADNTQREAIELIMLGALGAAALVRRARRLRRLAEVARAPGERRQPPSLEQSAYELLLEQFGDAEVLDWIESANRLLASAVRRPRDLEHIRLWRCSRGGVELLLEPPLPRAPSPFVARDEGRWWWLDAPTLRAAPPGGRRALPNLVPIGDDEEASYLLVLRPGRRLGLIGPPADVDAVLAAIVLGLRTMPWAEQLEIELLGIAEPVLAERSFHLHRSSTATLAELQADRSRGRAAEDDDASWRREPLVVIGRAGEPGTELLDALASELGVVVAGAGGTETLVLEDGGWLLSPFGIPLRPPRLAADTRALADALLADAGSGAPRPSEPPPTLEARASADMAGPVELVLLSSRARIIGVPLLDREDERRLAALVCHLLTHGRLASEEQLGKALFPHARTGREERLAQLAALARRCLGEDPDGRSRLSPLLGGSYRLSERVTGDWLRLRSLAEFARSAPPREAVEALRRALSLVEGVPLSDESVAFGTFRADGGFDELVADVVDAAHHLATLALAAGDARGARWALDRGLAAEPCSEMLARDALSLAEADGDLHALDATLERLERGLLALGGEPSSATLALYEQLRGHLEASD